MKNYIHNYKRFTEEHILNENIFDKIFNKGGNKEWDQKLLYYSKNGDLNGVKKCIENDADINCKSDYGNTPLMWSSLNGYLEIVKVLIENGADVNYTDQYGWTPLMCSSLNGHLEIVKVLIENGVDWNIKNDENKDFVDHLSDSNKNIIIREYPEEYKEYLFKKDVEKHNF
jgi:ankyrin repeat protein